MRGRPTKAMAAAKERQNAITYEQLCDQETDQDIITIHYDGIFKKGHWYEDHMLSMFAGCKLTNIGKHEYKVFEFPKKGGQTP